MSLQVDSRIIIDTEAHNKFLPNKAISLGPLKSVSESFAASDDEEIEALISEDDEDASIKTPDSTLSAIHQQDQRRHLTLRQLLTTVPFVRGYALKSKQWLWFFVSDIHPITFNSSAFSNLVLSPQQKDLILAFVESQIRRRESSASVPVFDDIISGKGKGMILLLSGPPGVGKTLTAESVAENLRVPLFMMSAGDLGLEPSSIESSLNTILEMVSKWSAVLLLDEADVFLEARSSNHGDLERNKMVSIFLRVLEYYEGILFLTTNRVKEIDQAFHSRIHVSLQYPALNKQSRRHVWQTFASRIAVPGSGSSLTDAELDELAEVNINGRQIKNVLKSAGILAMRKGGRGVVTMNHIKTILSIDENNS